MSREISVLLLCVLFIRVFCDSDQGMRCLDEDGQFVYWFVNYKLPKQKVSNPGSLLSEGKAYAHITHRTEGKWNMSSRGIDSNSSMMAKTLKTLYDNLENTTYLLYNDEPPAGYNGSSNGHLKGVVAFNGNTGFWIVHSIPKAFGIAGYKYPHTALMYGQSALCVTFTVQNLDEICNQLLYAYPQIYESHLTPQVAMWLGGKAKTIFSSTPAFNQQPPYNRTAVLYSEQKQIFISIMKDGLFEGDIYSQIMSTFLETPLSTETWRRGSGTYLPPSCDGPYDITDIQSIRLTAKNGTCTEFSSEDDHSKWAVTPPDEGSYPNWFCVGDMNRMESQAKRGGGALCFQSWNVVRAYQSLIKSSDSCPSRK